MTTFGQKMQFYADRTYMLELHREIEEAQRGIHFETKKYESIKANIKNLKKQEKQAKEDLDKCVPGERKTYEMVHSTFRDELHNQEKLLPAVLALKHGLEHTYVKLHKMVEEHKNKEPVAAPLMSSSPFAYPEPSPERDRPSARSSVVSTPSASAKREEKPEGEEEGTTKEKKSEQQEKKA